MADANSNAYIKETDTTTSEGLAAAAVAELLKFIDITKTNPAAMSAWNEHLQHEWPVIDVVDIRECIGGYMGTFILAPNLSRFIDGKVAA